jgi:arginase
MNITILINSLQHKISSNKWTRGKVRERIYQVNGAATGWGAQIRTCEDGPVVLEEAGCLEWLKKQNIPIEGWDILHPKTRFKEKDVPLAEALPLIVDFNKRLANNVFDAMQRGHFPVVIGGDHSIAVGTWNGVGCFLSDQSPKPLGLIWIDAHMDAHTLQTTPSGAWHGMPLAALLGYGLKDLVEIKRSMPILSPRRLCLIGVRSFEEGEAKLLESLNVRIYFMKEIEKRGFQAVLREAIDHVSQETVGYGVSLDIDVIDASEVPGTGSPEPGGLSSQELLQGLHLFANDLQLKALELVEFNPHLDIDKKTCKLCQEILITLLRQNAFPK